MTSLSAHPIVRQTNLARSAKLSVILYAGLCLGGIAQGASDPLERTLNAIMQVESSGGKDTRDGDSGRAHGPYQIHASYWAEGTRFLGVRWPHAEAHDAAKARRVVRAYLLHYQRLGGYPATPETWAKIHNGGPRGVEKAATQPYYARVRRAMQEGR